jgi:hypothetical protein
MPNKMERFTHRARQVLSLAQADAERLQHDYIGTEHLLLGLMREEGGVAGRVLRDLGLERGRVEELVSQMTRATTRMGTTQLDLSPGTKRVLKLAVDEARRMGHHYIGTEHVLLGLVRQSEGVAIDVLKRLGVSPDDVRRQTRRVLQESPVQLTPSSQETVSRNPVTAKTQPEAKGESWEDYAAAYSRRINEKLFPKLLSRLASEDVSRADMPRVIEELFSQVLIEESLVMSEDLRVDILNMILAPFKPEEDKRRLRFNIKDKAIGQVTAEGSLLLVEAREILRGAIEAVTTGNTGEVFILDDEKLDIRLTIEDGHDADATSSQEQT